GDGVSGADLPAPERRECWPLCRRAESARGAPGRRTHRLRARGSHKDGQGRGYHALRLAADLRPDTCRLRARGWLLTHEESPPAQAIASGRRARLFGANSRAKEALRCGSGTSFTRAISELRCTASSDRRTRKRKSGFKQRTPLAASLWPTEPWQECGSSTGVGSGKTSC